METINSGQANMLIFYLNSTKRFFLFEFLSGVNCTPVMVVAENVSTCDDYQKIILNHTFDFGGVWTANIYEQDTFNNTETANATLLDTIEVKIIVPETCENAFPGIITNPCPTINPIDFTCSELLAVSSGLSDAQKICIVQDMTCDFLNDNLTNNQKLCIETGSEIYVPTLIFPQTIGIYSFVLTWTAALNNYKFYLDVATDSLFTNMVSGFNNLDVGSVTTYTVTGLAGLHTYYCRIRAALDFVVIPELPVFHTEANVIYIDGSSDEIKTALALITDASANRIYKLVLPDNKTFNEKEIQTKEHVYIYIPPTTTVQYSHATGLLQDTFLVGGNCGIFGGGTISRTCDLADGSNNYPIHYTAGVAGNTYIYNLNIQALGTLSKDGIGIDINSGAKIYVKDCIVSSQVSGGILAHNLIGDTVSGQLYVVDTSISIPAGQYGVIWTNQGSVSGTDFVYVSGGNIDSFFYGNGGGGANEAFVFIDASTVWDGITTAWSDPSKLLSDAAFAIFIGSNGLSLSGYSNIIIPTTDSEGNNDLDNMTPGTVYAAWDTKFKLLTAYAGNAVTLRESTGNTEQAFGFVSDEVDQASVSAFKGAGNVYAKVFNDQSGQTRDFSNSTNGTQPKYDLSSISPGIPALLSDPSVSSLKLSSLNNIDGDLDLVAVLNIATTMSLFGAFTPINGRYYMGIWQTFGSNILQYYAEANTFDVGVYAVPRNTNVLIRVRVRGGSSGATINYYINGVLVPYTPSAFSTQDLIIRELFGFELGGPANYLDGHVTRAVIFTGAVDSDVAEFEQKCLTRYGI